MRQTLQQINSCYKAPGKIRSSRFHEVEAEIDKITMIALNLSITSLSQQREIEAVRSGIDKLTRDTENYLENIG